MKGPTTEVQKDIPTVQGGSQGALGMLSPSAGLVGGHRVT